MSTRAVAVNESSRFHYAKQAFEHIGFMLLKVSQTSEKIHIYLT